MSRLALGAAIWICGACLLLYLGLVVLGRFGSGRRFVGLVFEDDWHLSLPGLVLVAIGHWLTARARLDE